MVRKTIAVLLVFIIKLRRLSDWICCQLCAVQIRPVQVYSGDLRVFVGCVIIYPAICVTAAAVYGFVVAVIQLNTALRLLDTLQNMKELSDTFVFAVLPYCVFLHKCGTNKSGW